jgi:hypothetical protein
MPISPSKSRDVISELIKNDNFTSEITIFISLSLYFTQFRCRHHMKTSSLKRKKDTGSSMPISPSKSRDLADENNKMWTEWK